MSRDAQYRLWVRGTTGQAILPGNRQLMIRITPAGSSDLTTPITTVDVTYTAQREDTMPGTAGFAELVLGRPEARSRILSLALNKLPSALAGYIVKPRVALGGAITIGAYSRTFDTYNCVEIFSDRGKASGTVTTLEGIYYQRPAPLQEFESDGTGDVIYTMNLIGAEKFMFETMRVTDVEAWCFTNQTAVGTYRYVYQDVWGDGGRLYTVRHGDPEVTVNYRQFTMHKLSDVMRSVEGCAQLILSALCRRRAASYPVNVDFDSYAGTGNDHKSPRDVWTMYKSTHTSAWDYDDGAGNELTTAQRLLCTRIALQGSPTVPIGGFLNTPAGLTDPNDAPSDTLASWKTPWDWLADECASAYCKFILSYTNDPDGTLDLKIRFEAIETPHVAGQLVLTSSMSRAKVRGEIGAEAIVKASAVTPAATSADADAITFEGVYGSESDANQWNCPRGFHTNPVAWVDGARQYVTSGDPSSFVHITMQHFNCLTLYYLSNAGGLLAASSPIRIHHQSRVSTGSNFVSHNDLAVSLPVPNPIDGYGYNAPSNYGEGDTDMGTPYLAAVATAQRNAGMPYVAARAVRNGFGSPQQTRYSILVPRDNCVPEQVGNRTQNAAWPTGNTLLGAGATYFGDLPAIALVKSVADDLLGDTQSDVKLLGYTNL